MDERKVERVEVDGMELHVEPVDESDESDERPGGVHTALPPRVESWRRRSVTGAVLTGFAFGLREVLEPEREETAIIVQVSGEPVGDLPVEADLNERRPSESVVTVRPWLLTDTPGVAGDPTAGQAGDPTAGQASVPGDPTARETPPEARETPPEARETPPEARETEGGRHEPDGDGSAWGSPDR